MHKVKTAAAGIRCFTRTSFSSLNTSVLNLPRCPRFLYCSPVPKPAHMCRSTTVQKTPRAF